MNITRTELVWPGKYDEEGNRVEPQRVALPFQVIETVNVSRASREAAAKPEQRTLFDYWDPKEGATFEEGWRNKLIWGDNLLVMNSLIERFEGKVALIYIDPPFNSGTDFSFETEVGDGDMSFTKEQSPIEDIAYRDTWQRGIDSYLTMMSARLRLMRDLLSSDGSIFIHVDWSAGHYVKALADEIFGRDRFRNEIVWFYANKLGTGGRIFDKQHDTLLVYTRGETWFHELITRPVRNQKLQPVTQKIEGKRVWLRDAAGKRIYQMGRAETKLGDVWEIPYINPVSNERLGYATQKPEQLLDIVIRSSSRPNDIVADFFFGSGTALAVSERLGRRWLGCDLSRWAIHTTRKRLMDIEGCRPFEVLNLGKYERQYWQGVTFGNDGKDITQQAVFQYLAFVLRLYKANPVAGMQHLHGRRAGAMVHIGAVDSPVTIDEIARALDECVALKQRELHVLGWEWEMGLAGPNNDVRAGGLMHQAAKDKGIKLILLQIPREVMEAQAAAKGEVQFFELAFLDVAITKSKKLTTTIALKDFVIPNTELIPEAVRAKVTKWSDYIDYWSVDWDFRNDTFIQGFVNYRTRKSRKLSLVSDPHTYDNHGKYRVVVKVIDIFGNDTSQGYTVEV